MHQHLVFFFYGWVASHRMDVYRVLLTRSSLGRHLGCFHLLTVVASAAMNILAQAFVWTPVSSSFGHIYLGVELPAHPIILCLTYWGATELFPSSVCGFQVLRVLPNTCFFSIFFNFFFFYYSHPSGYELVSHHGFDLHFRNDWWHWASFHVVLGNYIVLS